MRTKLARYVLHTAFGIGVCAATATLASAQAPYYPPPRSGYAAPGSACPYPTMPSTVAPGVPGAALPPGAPPSAQPSAAPSAAPSGQPSTPQQPATPQRPEQPEQPQAQQPQNIAPEAAAAGAAAAAPTGAEAGLG